MATLVTPGGEDAPARLPPKKREPDAQALTAAKAEEQAKEKRVEAAQIRDLVKGQRCVVNQPYGGCLWHQKLCHHYLLSAARPLTGRRTLAFN